MICQKTARSIEHDKVLILPEFSFVKFLSLPLLSICSFLMSCQSWKEVNIFESQDEFEELRTYENNFGSRIEVFLRIAREELMENYQKNNYLMTRENQPRAVVHPRKDIALRELVVSSHEDGKITDQQKADYLKKCDEVYHLWDKHWKSADRKARRLGFDR